MVGYAAGGGTDSYARTLSSFIHEHLGMPFMITNKPGASGFIAAKAVADAKSDGYRLYVMAPRPGRIHKEYNLPFATMGLKGDLREIKNDKDFVSKREEILSMIWNMEEEIMGKEI